MHIQLPLVLAVRVQQQEQHPELLAAILLWAQLLQRLVAEAAHHFQQEVRQQLEGLGAVGTTTLTLQVRRGLLVKVTLAEVVLVKSLEEVAVVQVLLDQTLYRQILAVLVD
jgi:hypothetical protein